MPCAVPANTLITITILKAALPHKAFDPTDLPSLVRNSTRSAFHIPTTTCPNFSRVTGEQQNQDQHPAQAFSPLSPAICLGPRELVSWIWRSVVRACNDGPKSYPEHSIKSQQAYFPHLVHSAPGHYAFGPSSSFLSEYVQSLPKGAVIMPYQSIASAKRSNTLHTIGFPSAIEDARFPIVSGFTFPNAITRAIPLAQRTSPGV
ncbi:hypothetical protein K438DRAFT_1981065 [Mycena galopus ATCC 62051]|nr:hypothetical protein K438DRAFT_1981065 [Mycena galopus ATCC 62051]